MKKPLRDLKWSLAGLTIRNPPSPPDVGSVMFVCLGNICRSPFAEHLMRLLLAEAGVSGITCSSSGIRPSQAARAPAHACEVASSYGLGLEPHRPQLLTLQLVATHDVVVVMEAAQLRLLRRLYPRYRHRIFLLSLFDREAKGAYERYNIADPFGGPRQSFVECYVRTARALRRMAAAMRPPGA